MMPTSKTDSCDLVIGQIRRNDVAVFSLFHIDEVAPGQLMEEHQIYRVDNSANGAGRPDAAIRARASAVSEFLKQCLRGSRASLNGAPP